MMNYLRYLLGTCAGVLIITAAINWFIDPYAMYWSQTIEGVNLKKTEAGSRGRYSKRYVMASLKPDVIIIGNSRVEMGINPEHESFSQLTYNFGLPGLKLYSQIDHAIYEIQHNKNLKNIIISLDYVDFLHPQEILVQPLERLEWKSPQKELINNALDHTGHTKMLFSLNTLQSSLLTIIKQERLSSSITKLGFNTAQSFNAILKHEGKKPLFTQKLTELTKKLADKKLRFRSEQWAALGTNFDSLQSLFDNAERNQITVFLFINPYHMSYLHLLNDLGYWQDYQKWKYSLTLFLQSQNPAVLRNAVDFSGFNHITRENVNLVEPHKAMRWFWEPAHYNERLGNELIPIILGEQINLSIGKNLLSYEPSELIKEDSEGLLSSKLQWRELKKRLK